MLLPLAIGAGGRFRTGKLSEHTRTNATIIACFLGDVVAIDEGNDGTSRINVRGQRQSQDLINSL